MKNFLGISTCLLAYAFFMALSASAQLLPPPKGLAGDLSGKWKFGNTPIVIEHNGNQVVAKFGEIRKNDLGVTPGDILFEATKSGQNLTGTFVLRAKTKDGKLFQTRGKLTLTTNVYSRQLKGEYENKKPDRIKGIWTDTTRQQPIELKRDDQATPRFVQKTQKLGLDLNGTQGTFTTAQTLVEGRPYWIELAFKEQPVGRSRTVKVTWAGQEKSVQVVWVKEGIFRTAEPVFVELMQDKVYPPSEVSGEPPPENKAANVGAAKGVSGDTSGGGEFSGLGEPVTSI